MKKPFRGSPQLRPKLIPATRKTAGWKFDFHTGRKLSLGERIIRLWRPVGSYLTSHAAISAFISVLAAAFLAWFTHQLTKNEREKQEREARYAAMGSFCDNFNKFMTLSDHLIGTTAILETYDPKRPHAFKDKYNRSVQDLLANAQLDSDQLLKIPSGDALCAMAKSHFKSPEVLSGLTELDALMDEFVNAKDTKEIDRLWSAAIKKSREVVEQMSNELRLAYVH